MKSEGDHISSVGERSSVPISRCSFSYELLGRKHFTDESIRHLKWERVRASSPAPPSVFLERRDGVFCKSECGNRSPSLPESLLLCTLVREEVNADEFEEFGVVWA